EAGTIASARNTAPTATARTLNPTPALTTPPTRTSTHPRTTRTYACYAQRHAISGKNTKTAVKFTGRAESLDTPAASIMHRKIYAGSERCAWSTAATAQATERRETTRNG